MTFSLFFQSLINGLNLGATYALIALGYTMVYGIIRMINFAHGDFMLVDGRNTYAIQRSHHLLGQPDIFIFIAHFKAVLLVTDRGNIGQVFRCTGADGLFFIFFTRQYHPPTFLDKYRGLPRSSPLSVHFLSTFGLHRLEVSPHNPS